MTPRSLLSSCSLALLALFVVAASADTAEACGGCFAPTGQVTVVTAHRMAVSMSPERTILWDQFEYAGDPEDFVWVLPVAGGEAATIELADNAFFLALQQQTQLRLEGPYRSLPTASRGGGGGGIGCGAEASPTFSGADAGAYMPMEPPVEVHHEGTVGPYETAIIGSEDPEALLNWMQDRGYAVPDEMLPTITHYVSAEMDFVVLRLSPGAGVSRMQPVRVITPGLSTAFPLRMVAAGVADSVALELFVIGEGRYEAQNFPNGEVDRSAIIYDWATGTYNYDELADAALAEGRGDTWLTEYASSNFSTYAIENFSVRDEAGEVHTAVSDWEAATLGITRPTITRMRADLPAQALGVDLNLQASVGADLGNYISVSRDVNWDESSSTPPRSGFPTSAVVLFLLAAFTLHRLRNRAVPRSNS